MNIRKRPCPTSSKRREQLADKPICRHQFEEARYKYRIFCNSLNNPVYHGIDIYGQRADMENLVGEAKREGLAAIPPSKFKNNYAFFQLAMP